MFLPENKEKHVLEMPKMSCSKTGHCLTKTAEVISNEAQNHYKRGNTLYKGKKGEKPTYTPSSHSNHLKTNINQDPKPQNLY